MFFIICLVLFIFVYYAYIDPVAKCDVTSHVIWPLPGPNKLGAHNKSTLTDIRRHGIVYTRPHQRDENIVRLSHQI